MSVNCAIQPDRTPMLVAPTEQFTKQVGSVSFSVESGSGYPGQGGCFHGKSGVLYVSQLRLVYILTEGSGHQFNSFSLPLHNVTSFEFKKPMFGRTVSMKGTVNPAPHGGLVGVGRFTFEFKGGGTDAADVERVVTPLIHAASSSGDEGAVMAIPVAQVVAQGDSTARSSAQAYVDPNDPFTVFVSQ